MKAVLMMLMVVRMQVDAAPIEEGFTKASDLHPNLFPASALNPSPYMKRRLLGSKSSTLEETTKGATTRAMKAGRSRTSTDPATSEKRARMLKMISALEGLHRTFNSTLSSQISIMSRANGRNPARKNKVVPAADSGVKPTTATLSTDDITASRTSVDANDLSQTGRNVRKSQTPQTKKTNKRVCFWKYCSQN